MTTKQSGFTLIEVMVAIVILSVGLLALASSTANVSRMVGSGKWATVASQVATRRLENIRQVAYSTSPACTSSALVGGTAAFGSGISESWSVTGSGNVRQVQVAVTYTRAGGRSSTDTVSTMLRCI
jgi:prepilin-type N-terminal cleavage/methylation domain-containing protein